MSLAQDLKILYHLALAPVRGQTHQERLESFYAGQAQHYDAFRQQLLHGRQELYERIPVPDNGIWVEMGGGTGANLEYLGPAISSLRKAYVVDLSPSLLTVARERIQRRGWTNVTVVHEDVTALTLAEPVDVVTFSYSLTMIPNWYLALENAARMLRPGGLIAVVDFYVSRKHPGEGFRRHSAWARRFWPAWFGMDNVFPSPDHLPYLHQHFQPLLFEERSARLKFLPVAKAPYYLFLGRTLGDKARPSEYLRACHPI
jgi:S-adenosylmethionine-diacylgycerolhomoserine-N-methlytransferase